jgi:predicted nucleic acid-binding protein
MPSGSMTVVSNTSPLRYLIAVGRPDLIQKIFGQVLIPRGVEEELIHPSAPAATRQWIAERPEWLEVQVLSHDPEVELVPQLDQGECEAIQLAMDIQADFLLIDERRGRKMATDRGITVVGILGILIESCRRGHVQNPVEILQQLRKAGFRVSRRLAIEFEKQIAALNIPDKN